MSSNGASEDTASKRRTPPSAPGTGSPSARQRSTSSWRSPEASRSASDQWASVKRRRTAPTFSSCGP
eukprot:346311-Prymnesium_polylepis.1